MERRIAGIIITNRTSCISELAIGLQTASKNANDPLLKNPLAPTISSGRSVSFSSFEGVPSTPMSSSNSFPISSTFSVHTTTNGCYQVISNAIHSTEKNTITKHADGSIERKYCRMSSIHAINQNLLMNFK